MKPEDLAREVIDENLKQSGWTIQDMRQLNLTAMPQTVNNLAGCKRWRTSTIHQSIITI